MPLIPEIDRRQLLTRAKAHLHTAASNAHLPAFGDSPITFRGAAVLMWHFGVAFVEIALDLIDYARTSNST